MISYNYLEILLHKFVLSSQLMREVLFDIETKIIKPRKSYKQSIFIAGLARSGSTILLNAIYKSNIFASLTYMDMPFVLAPNLWSKLFFLKKNIYFKERAHGDGIKFSIKSPEAFEEVFWKTFQDKDYDSFKKFKVYISNINTRYNKSRYLSKNNQNIHRISLISKHFHSSNILVPFRDPIQHSYSLLKQHKRFNQFANKNNFIAKYMYLIGHTEFGPNYKPIIFKELNFTSPSDINHWLEQWYLNYKHAFDNYLKVKNVNFISYEKICNSKEYWFQLLEILEIKPFDFLFQESRKEFMLDIDIKLKNKALNLYSELSKIELK